ncbi:MAG: energy transducer TonB [Mucilaginibacter sp.]
MFKNTQAQQIKHSDTMVISNNMPFIDDSSIFPDKYGVYKEPEKLPQFPGGKKAYINFMHKNLIWPDKSRILNVQGKVYLSFIVEKNGLLTHFKITKKLHPIFDEEALRVVKKMPKWIPGEVNGKHVRSYYTLPINFQIEN